MKTSSCTHSPSLLKTRTDIIVLHINMTDSAPTSQACKSGPESKDKGRQSLEGSICSFPSDSATTSTLKRPATGFSDNEDKHLRREPSRRKRGLRPSTDLLTQKSASSRRELPSPPSFVGSGISKLNQPYWRRAKGVERGFSKSLQSLESEVLPDGTERRLADCTLQPCPSGTSEASAKGRAAVSETQSLSQRTETD
jgi:hypothetical protein